MSNDILLAESTKDYKFSDGFGEGWNISVQLEANDSKMAFVHLISVSSKLEVNSISRYRIDEKYAVEITMKKADRKDADLNFQVKHMEVEAYTEHQRDLGINTAFDAKLSRLLHVSILNGNTSGCGFIGVSDARGGYTTDAKTFVSANLNYTLQDATVRIHFIPSDMGAGGILRLSSPINNLLGQPDPVSTTSFQDVNVPKWGLKMDQIVH